MKLDYERDVRLGSVVEQTLVDATGITVKQINPQFRRNIHDQTTSFHLNFLDEKTRQEFIVFYNQKCPGSILRVLGEVNKTRIDFDTLRFVNEIIPILKAHLQEKRLPAQQTSPFQPLMARLAASIGLFLAPAKQPMSAAVQSSSPKQPPSINSPKK